MCTLTVIREGSGLLVTMNRDERRSRGAESPPALHLCEATSMPWAAPGDSLSGGSWMGVNAAGVVACVLNMYQPEDGKAREGSRHVSRGTIVPEVLGAGHYSDALRVARALVAGGGFDSFNLVVVGAQRGVVLGWNGTAPSPEEDMDATPAMLTSSSWKTREVLKWRSEQFREWARAGAELEEGVPSFHTFQPDGMAEWAPLMARAESCTRSITQAEVAWDVGEAMLRWWPNPATRLPEPKALLKLALVR